MHKKPVTKPNPDIEQGGRKREVDVSNPFQLTNPSDDRKRRVLFVCTGNTCRSVLAKHIARKKFGKYIEVASAGLCPGSTEDAENAVYTLKSLFDLDASSHRPRDVRTVGIDTFDLVIAMENQVAKQLKEIFPDLAGDHLVRWKIKDPYGDDLSEYQNCAAAINTHLKQLAVYWNHG